MEVLHSYLASLVKPKHNFPGWLIVIISLAFAGLSGVFFLQTELYLELQTPDQKWIDSHRAGSQKKQDELRKKVGAASSPEPFIDFNDNHKRQLIEARSLVENDKDLQNLLENRFGRNFKGLQVVMLPMWSSKVQDNWDQAGITADARWSVVQDAFYESDAKAVTVRERADQPQQMTLDGIPRIVVKDQAFASTTTLQKTIFHELLHAINLPGYRYKTRILGREIEYTKAQDDLCYLPEYRQYVSKARLWEYWECVPGAGFIAFGLFSLGGMIYLVGRSKFGW